MKGEVLAVEGLYVETLKVDTDANAHRDLPAILIRKVASPPTNALETLVVVTLSAKV